MSILHWLWNEDCNLSEIKACDVPHFMVEIFERYKKEQRFFKSDFRINNRFVVVSYRSFLLWIGVLIHGATRKCKFGNVAPPPHEHMTCGKVRKIRGLRKSRKLAEDPSKNSSSHVCVDRFWKIWSDSDEQSYKQKTRRDVQSAFELTLLPTGTTSDDFFLMLSLSYAPSRCWFQAIKRLPWFRALYNYIGLIPSAYCSLWT